MTLLELRLVLVSALMECNMPILYGGDLTIDSVTKDAEVDTYRSSADIEGSLMGQVNELMFHISIEHALDIAELNMIAFPRSDIGNLLIFDVCDGESGDKMFEIRLRKSVPLFGDDYKLPNGVECFCVTREFLIADRISTLSGGDMQVITDSMYDLYRLSFIQNEYTTDALRMAARLSLISFGDFVQFLSNADAISVQYNELSNIVNKPSFDTIYARVKEFVSPFIYDDDIKKCWNGTAWV